MNGTKVIISRVFGVRFAATIAGYIPQRMISNSAGFFVVFPNHGRCLLTPEHCRNDGHTYTLDNAGNRRRRPRRYSPRAASMRRVQKWCCRFHAFEDYRISCYKIQRGEMTVPVHNKVYMIWRINGIQTI